MSTKSTLAYTATDDWHLYEEMIDDTTRLRTNSDFSAGLWGVDVEIPPAVLDAIARLHAAGQLPHQRPPESPDAEEKPGEPR